MGRASRRGKRPKTPARPNPAGPNALAPTAADVPLIRARMLEWAGDRTRYGALAWLRALTNAARTALPGFHAAPAHDEQMVARWAKTLAGAELFYVAEALSTLTRHAAESLTGYHLHPEDLPADSGFLVFADPLRDTGAPDPDGLPINLITWAPMAGSIVIDFWTPTSYQDPSPQRAVGFPIPGIARILHENRNKIPGHLRPPHILPTHGFMYQRAIALPFGAPVDVDHVGERLRREHTCQSPDICALCAGASWDRDTARLQRLIVATWLLMGQTITVQTPIRRAPTGAAPARRAPAQDPAVRYVELRAAKTPPREPDSGHEHGKRLYVHSWVVRGHWRRQWFPSRGEHRPLWIHAHLAGPDGAPLIGGERVNVLRR
jgi:hypothetical protein